MKASPHVIVLAVLLLLGGPPSGQNGARAQSEDALPACEWCGAEEAPDELSWKATIAGPDEPGEPLVIAGTVYEPDGTTPAAGVILYAYHTNAEGIYPTRGNEAGNGQRHGYLRAWVRTDERGRYQFTTIRPGTYPTRSTPAHIHMTVKEPDKEEYWIDQTVFAGDPLVSMEDRKSGGFVHLSRDGEGVWWGTRDVILKK